MSDKKPKYIPGVGWRYETEHRQTRRHTTHDYGGVGTYLVTMTIEGRQSLFGYVDGDLRAPKGTEGYAHLVATPLAEKIVNEEVLKIHHYYPMVDVWRMVLMPDHLHMIVRVSSPMPKGKSLGSVIRGFKTGCCRAWWALMPSALPAGVPSGVPSGKTDGTGAVGDGTGAVGDGTGAVGDGTGAVGDGVPVSSASSEDKSRPLLFSPGYNDHILMNDGQLDNWKAYIEENPFRLLIRQRHPEIMQRALCITINGKRFSAFGNFMLLKYPEKQQVMCHRKATIGMLTQEERKRYGYTCPACEDMKTSVAYETTAAFEQEKTAVLDAAKEGVVVVTPGISRGEQIIKHECMEQRLPLIHLQKEPITELWKPEKSRFYACTSGRLLILAPWAEDLQGSCDYEMFHNLNDLAKQICEMNTSEANCGYKAVGQKPTGQGLG